MKDWLPVIAVVAITGGAISYFVTDGFAFDSCDEIAAYGALQAEMAQHLKAPSTAIYEPWDRVAKQVLDACMFNLEGYVESQNSFGAMGKTTFKGQIIKGAEGEYKAFVTALNGRLPGL